MRYGKKLVFSVDLKNSGTRNVVDDSEPVQVNKHRNTLLSNLNTLYKSQKTRTLNPQP